MSRPVPQRSAIEGFALIDVLVGLAILGVISALMVAFLGQARTMVRIENASQMQMEVDAATRFLEATLGNAEALPLTQSTPDDVIYFSGAADRLQFNGIMAIGFGSSALRQVSILPTGDGRLAIVQQPRRGGGAGVPEERSVPLIGGVTGVRFEYLDGEKGSWSADWKLNRRLPAAIRFRISVARDGAAYTSDGFARLSLAGQQAGN
ncbi:general secretion pathway protein GspJ [Mesorhizobium sp. M00.F.Ca.ET.186.01.1.1]|nr:general secretion pathway protein GspJ [bacterium M00.F.Ca.ET.205.01.1.1]TGU54127.1 general secretion pathway protein GspJ [bacterium M00.F.Ca.ET.152.01.1.1]TGV37631.1 general secretion pathway protein GspJ [Mesorhizobium sp. M00.F.Ca.ET.186.01.1.1]TGZ39474.1 general secretion pathway protein GspJ [bacterium M00.F.Ca.ET.162.01.1.1]TIW61269.1 MAG: general secretion pathway protein GspJ [Mesorhizobium sp.]